MTNTRRIRVLYDFKEPRDEGNPYTAQLARSMPSGVAWKYFRWGSALVLNFDVVHLHWPEYLIRNNRVLVRFAKRTMAVMLALKWRFARTALVQTIHNETPHEPSDRFEAWFLAHLARYTTAWVALNSRTPHRSPYTITVLHGHYRDWFEAYSPDDDVEPGRLLFFGLIRPYKGIPALLEAYSNLPDGLRATTSLAVVGRPIDAQYRRLLSEMNGAQGVEMRLEAIPDSDLVKEIYRSELVLLPYTKMGNSGAALTALSLRRPVLLPATEASRELRAEVGQQWVTLYEGPLTADKLALALDESRRHSYLRASKEPDLSAREWTSAGAKHLQAYESAIAARRGS